MPFFNGDRVCSQPGYGNKLKFGRVREYTEEFTLTPAKSESERDAADNDDAENIIPPDSPRPGPKMEEWNDDDDDGQTMSKQAGKQLMEQTILGFSPPVMVTKQPVVGGRIGDDDDGDGKGEGGSGGKVSTKKRQIVWDDQTVVDDVQWFGEAVYKVVDRKFPVGQRVYRCGRRGMVTEVIPLATVKIWDCGGARNKTSPDSGSKSPTVTLIPDLGLDDIRPISPLFAGVNIEYKGWLGQIVEVQRATTYKLGESLDGQDTYVWTFTDTSLVKNSLNAHPISKLFAYPFLPSSSVIIPYKGKRDKLDKSIVRKQLASRKKEIANKENNQNHVGIDDHYNGSRISRRGATTVVSNSLTSHSPSKAKRNPSLSLSDRRKTRNTESIRATVESVSVTSIQVRWTGRLPTHLIKPSAAAAGEKFWIPRTNMTTARSGGGGDGDNAPTPKLPPAIICGKDLQLVRPLYVHPVLYFDKMGLSLCNTKITKGMKISEQRWMDELYTSLTCHKDKEADRASFNLSSVTLSPPPPPKAALRALRKDSEDCSGSDSTAEDIMTPTVKRKRWCEGRAGGAADQNQMQKDAAYTDDDDSPAGGDNDVIVCKHFVRHMYKVIWEPRGNEGTRRSFFTDFSPGGDSGLYYGSQLEPDMSQEHKICLGIHSHLYVVAKRGSWMVGIGDYGVVIEKPDKDSVIVEWLRICSDGSAMTGRILKCRLDELDNHPTFNELHEGRIVVRRKEAAKYKLCKQFSFGTVVTVERFSRGQISVYCSIQKKIVSLWPHMLEVYVGMSMQDLIAHQVVGMNKRALQLDESNETEGEANGARSKDDDGPTRTRAK